MPTERKELRPLEQKYPYFYKHLERMQILDMISISWLVVLMIKKEGHRRLLRLHRMNHPRLHMMAMFLFRRQKNLMLSALFLSSAFLSEFLCKKSDVIFPTNPDWRCQPKLDSTSPIWDSTKGEETFEFRYRFRRSHFFIILQEMGLMDANGFKYLMVGNEGHRWRLRFDTAFMILLRYLSFPARFADHVDEFNMPSNRIAEAFHDMSDFLYVRYAYKPFGQICFLFLPRHSAIWTVLLITTLLSQMAIS